MELRISPRVRGGTILQWSGQFKPGTVFTVEYSDNGVDFEDLADTYDLSYEDPTPRHFGGHSRVHYRVTAVEPGGAQQSVARQALGNLTPAEWGMVSVLRRNEELQSSKMGRCGWLLKRRHWGEACPDCRDPYTGDEIPERACATCYGVGLVGGYHTPVLFRIRELGRAPRRIKVEAGTGTSDPQTLAATASACYWVDANDLWISADTDERYYIQESKAAGIRGVPTVYETLELRRINPGDIAYAVPRPA